jgi:hypothetical protein
LANIVFDDLDKELERRRHRFVRYADDVIILVKDSKAGERMMTSIRHFIERKLKFKVNEVKSQVARIDQADFLGFTFKVREENVDGEVFFFLTPPLMDDPIIHGPQKKLGLVQSKVK